MIILICQLKMENPANNKKNPDFVKLKLVHVKEGYNVTIKPANKSPYTYRA